MSTSPPYRASWVDRLIALIAALPGPTWVPYAIVSFVVGLAVHVTAWIDGLLAPGDFDLYLGSLAIYVIASLAAIHVLDGRATQAWATFRPVTSLTEEQAERILFELTTLPARSVLSWTAAGFIVAIITSAAGYGQPLDLEGEPITFLVATVVGAFAYMTGAVLVYHTIRQLRLISRLPGYVERIDLLDAGPLHAFSVVTALTGGFFVVAAYFSVVTDPTTFTNPAVAAVNASVLVLAVACFVLPLSGMQRRIAVEKARRLSAVSHRLDAALRDLARRNDAGDLSDADAVHSNITSLLAERELIARTTTWPWSTGTLRGFSTAVLLPVVLWLVFRVLEQVLE
jgi:hypothetical protein